ncbi:hypothetical protein K9B35_06740 [Sphingomonas sp. R647]|uniref:hypothetical protein n=1 Tax=Sphingomonas sp. R647 TaxID=2875233 RepID=UPI001CD695DC|nr:hypothetical protein [Sphingomonas sp. R647]MCA1197656.1 hypothetical protein [Sphingomonas sp. R647]
MRLLLAISLTVAAAPLAFAQSADAIMPHPGQYMEPQAATWEQRRAEKTADQFGQCVVRQQPAAASAFIDQALAERAVPAKPAALKQAIEGCISRSAFSRAKTYLVKEQDTAIYRAVLNSRGTSGSN